eukprot:2311179-Alexandrium_andersonii.AAC.1
MSASLVGSEMCIRDRARAIIRAAVSKLGKAAPTVCQPPELLVMWICKPSCLLYTSDAADDM